MNFDDLKNRSGGHGSKWNAMQARTGVSPEDGIAMWVADMDFDAPECVRAAIHSDVDEGFLGYYGDVSTVSAAVVGWMRDRHGWNVNPRWIRYTHGVVAGFGAALHAFTRPGDAIVLFTPVYHAFFGKARAMDRTILQSRLVLEDGRYRMDLDALAEQLTGREKIAVLCQPHNPCGRIWTAEEISSLAEFCAAHDLLLLSDEIHMDLTFPGVAHIPAAAAAPAAAPRLVTITAASKGFNLAGMETGIAIIADDDLRRDYDRALGYMSGSPNRFGMLMTEAAFTRGAEWSAAVRAYLAENFRIWRDRIGALPGVSVMDMQATYLAWVDFAGTGMSAEESTRRLTEDARIAVSVGQQFGAGGETFHRFNLAMPRARLMQAIERIEAAFSDLQ